MDRVSEGVPGIGIGSMKSCLVEGDAEFEKRARRVKSRALVFSIVLQTIVVAALVLFPLLGKGERISLKDMTPMPPYNFSGGHARNTNTAPRNRAIHPLCRFCAPPGIPQCIATHTENTEGHTPDSSGPFIPGLPPGPSLPGGLTPPESSTGPEPPPREQTSVQKERIVVGHIEPAMLVRRIEPMYPPLAKQLHREGRVELRAIISEDGSIQQLEAVSGDPLLIQSALAAVREWRYRPTYLNGKAVEVDTHITVIYSIAR